MNLQKKNKSKRRRSSMADLSSIQESAFKYCKFTPKEDFSTAVTQFCEKLLNCDEVSDTDDSQLSNKQQKVLRRFWNKRYRLFSKFDEGIKLDYESWFSVTPEKIAKHMADRCKCNVIIDAFCGAGGNAIHFALTCEKVYAIDIDPVKIEYAQNNAKIYGVEHKIEFIIGDFFHLAERLTADAIFLSPPWGGPSYKKDEVYDLENIMSPHGGTKLYQKAKEISKNIAYYLPRNTNKNQLAFAAGPQSKIEIENNYLDGRLIAITAYYGNLIN